MPKEKEEPRINIEDLPLTEKELSEAEAKEVTGGSFTLTFKGQTTTPSAATGTDGGIWRGSN